MSNDHAIPCLFAPAGCLMKSSASCIDAAIRTGWPAVEGPCAMKPARPAAWISRFGESCINSGSGVVKN